MDGEIDEKFGLRETKFKHSCRICKRRFACGRALGGHMRVHASADESEHESESEFQPAAAAAATVDYELASDFGGSCDKKRHEQQMEQPRKWKSDNNSSISSKSRKRIKTNKFMMLSDHEMYEEEHQMEMEMANCLMMLANGDAPQSAVAAADSDSTDLQFAIPEEEDDACSSEQDNLGKRSSNSLSKLKHRSILFECRTCRKVFDSYQALGGHRSSHRKSKHSFAAHITTQDDEHINKSRIISIPENDQQLVKHTLKSGYGFEDLNDMEKDTIGGETTRVSQKQPKIHQCSVCHRIFASGQALGGHKRSHSSMPEISSNAAADVAESNANLNSSPAVGSLLLDSNMPVTTANADASNFKFFNPVKIRDTTVFCSLGFPHQ